MQNEVPYNRRMPETRPHFIDRIAFVVGATTSGLALFPQAWQVVNGTAAGIAVSTFGIIAFNSAVWLAYASHHKLLSLGISSLLNLVASLIIVLYIVVL